MRDSAETNQSKGIPGEQRETYVEVPLPGMPARVQEAVPAPSVTPRKVAVVVTHGMGNQVPFETLQLVGHLIIRPEMRRHTPGMGVKVRLVNLCGVQLPRAELTLYDADNQPIDVHLYEAYWAPLTEGKVTARDSVWFLFMAGLRGIWGAGFTGKFRRWMFGDWQKFSIPHVRLFFYFLAAMLVIASLVLMNAAIVGVAASRSLVGTPSSWPSSGLLADLTNDLGFYELRAILFLGIGIGFPSLLRKLCEIFQKSLTLFPPIRWVLRTAVAFAILLTIGTGRNVLCHLFIHREASRVAQDYPTRSWLSSAGTSLTHHSPAWASSTFNLIGQALRWSFGSLSVSSPDAATPIGKLIVVWIGAITIAYLGRWFLREFVGDVAAYVSSYTVSKFDELRNQIQEACLSVMGPVYKQLNATGKSLEYEEIVVVGHSLGSVIAYDTLNSLYNSSLMEGLRLDVARRTKALITFGSPLDKTAFIFRNQRPQQNDIREALAASKQPLILAYPNRPRRWVNIYSADDWISGSLEFYDVAPPSTSLWKRLLVKLPFGPRRVHPALAGGHLRVDNREDPEVCIPLVGHTFYWTGEELCTALRDAIFA